jgi:hypothetical protein
MDEKLVFTKWLRENGVDVKEFIRRAIEEGSLATCINPGYWVVFAFALNRAEKEGFRPKQLTWSELFLKWNRTIQQSYSITFDNDSPKWNREILERKYLKGRVKVFHGKRNTVFIYKGRKVVSKCQKGDRYSRLAGLASAAMKLAGFTYEEIALALDESKKNAYKSGQESKKRDSR